MEEKIVKCYCYCGDSDKVLDYLLRNHREKVKVLGFRLEGTEEYVCDFSTSKKVDECPFCLNGYTYVEVSREDYEKVRNWNNGPFQK